MLVLVRVCMLVRVCVCACVCVCVCARVRVLYLLVVLGGNSRLYLLPNMTGTTVPCNHAVFILARSVAE